MSEKKKYIRRMLPCGSFDIERIESWLQDMAAEGLHQAYRKSVGCFERGEPKTVRYRVQPKKSTYDDDIPDKSTRELFAEYGWDYVTEMGTFHVYRAEDLGARELNTEPETQADAFKRLAWRQVRSCLIGLIAPSLFIYRVSGELMRFLVTFGIGSMVMWAVMLACGIFFYAVQIGRFVRLYRKLKKHQPLDHKKPWRRGAIWHRLGSVALALAYVMFLIMLLSRCTSFVVNSELPINDYPGDPPFVTIQDLYPEGEYSNETSFAGYNHYTIYESGNAPMNVEWREYATVILPDGETLEGAMIVHYHETKSEELARGLAEEYLREAYGKQDFQKLTPPQVDADFVAAYSISGMPTLIMQKGNITVTAGFTIRDGEDYPVEKWAEMMLQMLK